jgi:hypothetical protein
MTKTNLVNTFNLSVEDQNGLDLLKNTYDALPIAIEKHILLHKIESAGIFYQNGVIDKTKYKQILGLS